MIKSLLIIFCAGLVLSFTSYPVRAAENEIPTEGEKSTKAPEEPNVLYEAVGSFYLGYRFLSQEDSLKAAEYMFPSSSVTFGMDLLGTPLPHRYHLNGEFLSKHDFYTDTGYAYKDFIQFRDILVGIHHNLDHFYYMYPGSPPSVTYKDRNQGETYFVDYINNLFSLRLKAPDFPFHAFVRHRYVEQEGKVDERFVLGSIGNLVKISEARTIDWKSNAVTLGANSHLGPIEIEYAYDQADFDPGSNNVLYDSYSTSFVFSRPGDIYAHNVVPETESFGNSLKLHTSYTGGIVASATLSNLSQQNNYSGTDSQIWKGAFDLSWKPDPVINLFFKYRHKDLDFDNADIVKINGAVNTLSYPVRQGISYNRDQFFLTARYKPMNSLSLLSTYEFSHQKRDDIEDWPILPDETNRHNINLTAHVRPLNKLKLKAVYDYTHYENPAYNTEPDNANRLRLSGTYLPVPWMTAYVNYVLALTDRDDLRYLNSNPRRVLEGGERDGRTDNLLASLSFAFSPGASLTATWAYNRWKVEQDLAYSQRGASGKPYYDSSVPYTDETNTLFLSLFYLLRKDLTLTADVSYTITEGEYQPGYLIQSDLASLPSFSSLETTETVVSVALAKKIFQNWEIGLKFYADFYNDKFSDDTGDHQDGELYMTTLSLKRFF